MDVDGSLVCEVQDPYWKRVERSLRQEIYKWEHCPADMVLLPYLLIPHIYRNTSYGMTVEEERAVVDKKNDITGHYYKTQIFGMEDVEKIKRRLSRPVRRRKRRPPPSRTSSLPASRRGSSGAPSCTSASGIS